MAIALDKLEKVCRDIGHLIGDALPPRVGFTLIVYDFAEAGEGHMTYLSNAQRDTMIAMLKEMVQKLESGTPQAKS